MNIVSSLRKSKLAIVAIVLSSVLVYGYPSGVSGYTLKTSTSSCGSCHGTSANSSVKVVISGPTSLATGATGNYTCTITYSTLSGTGVDIAASSGSLIASDSRLKVLSSELTHKAKVSGSGSVAFTFQYTAPTSAGVQTLYATGCGAKSYWNHASNFSVTVTAANSLSLISPVGGQNWQVGSSQNITWSSAGVTNVKLEYSTDNGSTWSTIVTSTPASTGSYAWTVPNTASTQCKVRVSNVDNSALNSVSANTFTISAVLSVYPISHLRANDANGVSVDTGLTVTIRGVVSVGNEFNSPSFIQDGTGGVAIYGRGTTAFSGMSKIGDSVSVTGKVVNYNGLTEINPVSSFTKLDSNKSITPLVVTLSQVNTQTWQSNAELYEGRLIRIKNVHFKTATSTWAVSGSGTNFTVTDGTDTLQVRVYATVTDLANQTAPTGNFDVIGALGQYKSGAPYSGGYQLQPRNKNDIISGSAVSGDKVVNRSYRLEQNYPNPFNPTTTITYTLLNSGKMSLKLYNVTGNLVQVVSEGVQSAGVHSVQLNCKTLPSGIYFYTLETGAGRETKKLTLLK
ncbi:MAG: DUF5689 domain-containing protein [Ignavibacteria bacterium]|nr:DUF5689 domain-containing protein [Ignavibacteria bacterium]